MSEMEGTLESGAGTASPNSKSHNPGWKPSWTVNIDGAWDVLFSRSKDKNLIRIEVMRVSLESKAEGIFDRKKLIESGIHKMLNMEQLVTKLMNLCHKGKVTVSESEAHGKVSLKVNEKDADFGYDFILPKVRVMDTRDLKIFALTVQNLKQKNDIERFKNRLSEILENEQLWELEKEELKEASKGKDESIVALSEEVESLREMLASKQNKDLKSKSDDQCSDDSISETTKSVFSGNEEARKIEELEKVILTQKIEIAQMANDKREIQRQMCDLNQKYRDLQESEEKRPDWSKSVSIRQSEIPDITRKRPTMKAGKLDSKDDGLSSELELSEKETLQHVINELVTMLQLFGVNLPMHRLMPVVGEELARLKGWDRCPERESDGDPMYIGKLARYAQKCDPMDLLLAHYLFTHRDLVKANETYSMGISAIFICADNPILTGMLEWFLKEGTLDPNIAKMRSLHLPIHMAARKGHLPAVKLLIEDGRSDINAQKQDGWTPLMLAAVNDHSSVVSVLLEHGCDKTKKDEDGRTALDLARKENNTAAVALLDPSSLGTSTVSSLDLDCMCGAKMKRTLALLAYDSGTVKCDGCRQNQSKVSMVYTCPRGKSAPEHPSGFDMCETCALASVRLI